MKAMTSGRNAQWTVGARLTAFTFTLVSTIFIAFILFVIHSMSISLEKRATALVNTQAQGVGNLIDSFNRTQLATVDKFYQVFSRMLPGTFSIDAQRTTDVGGKVVPVLQHDGADLNLNFDAVDRFTQMTGGNATIFIKKDDDFIRVATSVKKADGNRAVGTNLGKTHPGYAALIRGDSYRGMAVLFGKPHVTEYVPIKDRNNAIVGILYVGVDISDDMAALQERIKSFKVGESGYFFVLNSKEGDALGNFVVHPDMQGKNGLALRDTKGREYIKEMLQSKQGTMLVTPVEADSKSRGEELVVYQTNKDWNWTFGGVAFVDEITSEVSHLRNILLISGAIALLGFAALLWFIVGRVISRPLALAKDAAERLAQGDLTVRLTASRQDEIGQLMTAMNGISQGLATVVTTIREGTHQVAAASGQIATGNQDLSARTEHQAGALEETASAMEELTTTVQQNADNARHANELASSASAVAIKGGEAVSQVVSTMGAINEASRKIGDITGVIDGIAFQTNILALNAAVEAARAGEQGRGFAVVASEVRSLAQRAASAAKEIKELIGDSFQKVETGSKLVSDAGQTMDEVVASVRKVNDIMAEILAATHEQSSGIQEVNRAIGSMDQTTQQNAALVEEAAAAAHSMEELAVRLAQSVSVFKLDGA